MKNCVYLFLNQYNSWVSIALRTSVTNIVIIPELQVKTPGHPLVSAASYVRPGADVKILKTPFITTDPYICDPLYLHKDIAIVAGAGRLLPAVV